MVAGAIVGRNAETSHHLGFDRHLALESNSFATLQATYWYFARGKGFTTLRCASRC